MNKKGNKILIILIATFMAFLSIGSVIKSDISFSENENRYLEERPELNLSRILNGKFEEDYEDYLSDQIIFRESWIKLMSLSQEKLGIKDINGVYLLKRNGFALKITSLDFDYENFNSNIERLSEFIKIYQNTCVMIIPTQEYVLYDELPKNALTFNEDEKFDYLIEKIGSNFIDLREELLGDVFYRTDHHWNNEGVKIGYIEYCKFMNIEPLISNDKVLTTTFQGTLYSKVLAFEYYDSISTDSNAYDKTYKVICDGNEFDSIYFNECLNEKDKYKVFLGGNYSRVDIYNEDATSDKTILVIKDSYANSFMPYLCNNYSSITMIDPRYYGGSIIEIAKEYDNIFLLFSLDNFMEQKVIFE